MPLAINRYWARFAAGLTELIHTRPGGTCVKDGPAASRTAGDRDEAVPDATLQAALDPAATRNLPADVAAAATRAARGC
jgi:hypothetical protein